MAPRALAQSRPQRQHAGAFQHRLQRLRAVDGMHHQFRPRRVQREHVLGARGDADQAGTRAQGGLTGQPRGTGHAVIATDNQHMAVVALVRMARARRQRLGDQQQGIRLKRRIHAGRHAQRGQLQRADPIDGAPAMQPALVRDEGDGDIRADHRARAIAAVGRQAGRQVECQHGYGAGVDRFDERRSRRIRRAVETDAVHRVHMHIGLGQRLGVIPKSHPSAGGLPPSARLRRLATRAFGERHHIDLQPRLARQHTQQETVAAVVAGAAMDRDPRCLRPMPTQAVECSMGRTQHQLVVADGHGVQRTALQRAHLVDGVEGAMR